MRYASAPPSPTPLLPLTLTALSPLFEIHTTQILSADKMKFKYCLRDKVPPYCLFPFQKSTIILSTVFTISSLLSLSQFCLFFTIFVSILSLLCYLCLNFVSSLLSLSQSLAFEGRIASELNTVKKI